MKLYIEYDIHPDMGGTQKIYDSERGSPVSFDDVIGKVIVGVKPDETGTRMIFELDG